MYKRYNFSQCMHKKTEIETTFYMQFRFKIPRKYYYNRILKWASIADVRAFS